MTDRERLVNLMRDLAREITCWGGEMLYLLNPEKLADHLIAHGVTVKQMQKPMTALEISRKEGLKGKRVYLETKEDGKIVEAVVLRGTPNAWNSFAFDVVGGDRVSAFEYHLNIVYRCWAEKPTDEERKAAEWEK